MQKRNLLISAGLFLAVFFVYAQVRHFDFINFDDPEYVTSNAHVRHGITPAGLQWALTSSEAANWFPLTRLSHMLDVQAFGLDSGLHHLTNVFLHAIAAMLLFAFLNRATGDIGPSVFVALLFALHPMHVESVAWVSERKDVLSALFWFLTLWAYVRYTERPQVTRYLIVLASFCLGLMSKPMIVTLPFVMLLLDVWPLRRPKMLREKLPLFALSIAVALTTYLVQRGSGAVEDLAIHPLGLRIENTLVSYAIYIAKMFWPADLAVFYPYPTSIPVWQLLLAVLVLAGISVVVFRTFRSRPYLAVGWIWFLGTLVPVIGLVQVGGQARADRYMYIPMVGLSIMLAWGIAEFKYFGIAACAACAVVTWVQIGYWKNSETLFQHAIAVTRDNYVAQHNLGTALLDRGRLPEAISHLQEALRIRPGAARAHTDLGNALSKMPDRLPEAVVQYETALRIAPSAPITHNDLGNTLSRIPGRLSEAIAEYQTALRIDPGYAEAHNNLGNSLAKFGRMPEAIAQFEEALRIEPDYAQARANLTAAQSDTAESHYNSGVILSKAGRTAEAISEYEAALRINPEYAEAHSNLGVVLSGTPDAISHFEKAIRLRPDYPDAHYNLGVALANSGRVQEAIIQFEIVERLRPDPEVRQILERLRARPAR